MPKSTTHYFHELSRIHAKCWANYEPLLARFPFDESGNADLRLALFSLPGHALRAHLLALTLLESSLLDPAWWAQHSPQSKKGAIREAIGEYDKSVSHCYFLLFLSRIEWVLRNMVVLIKPAACNGGRAAFKAIYDCLFAELGKSDLTTVFDLARHLRNTIHNNGKYITPRGTDSAEYSYRERSIKFVYGKGVYGATDLSFELMDDLVDSCESIVAAPQLEQWLRMDFMLDVPGSVNVGGEAI